MDESAQSMDETDLFPVAVPFCLSYLLYTIFPFLSTVSGKFFRP